MRKFNIPFFCIICLLTSCSIRSGTVAKNLIYEKDGVRIYLPNKENISCDSNFLLVSVDYTSPENIIISTENGTITQNPEYYSQFILVIDCLLETVKLDVFRLTDSQKKEKVSQLKIETKQ
jgi:hypothetical protein